MGAPSPRVSRALVERHVAEVLFAPSSGPPRIGAEVELVPVDAESRRRVPIETDDPDVAASGPILRALARSRGWATGTSAAGAPAFWPPGGGEVSFEPGGQIEYSAPPHPSIRALVDDLTGVVREIVQAGERGGVVFVCRGFDPDGATDEARLELTLPRYRRMAAHYDRRGPWGRRMMRQSAAIHVNLDSGPEPLLRWRVANRAAPALLAIFANSPRAGGRETDHRSWRAAQWRRLDPTRTGLPGGLRPTPGAYATLVRRAEAFALGPEGRAAVPFDRWIETGADMDDLRRHLTTLFPEVRPRGYLELRLFDALPPGWYAVPLVVASGLLYDPEALTEADALLEPVGTESLETAGRSGVRDAALRRHALEIFDLALEGARRAGIADGRSLERARDFRARLTARGLDPGDEPGDLASIPPS